MASLLGFTNTLDPDRIYSIVAVSVAGSDPVAQPKITLRVPELACHRFVGPQVAAQRMVIFPQRSIMKDSTKDKLEGTTHELKGAVKEKLGHASNNADLESKGKTEKVAGKIQKKVGDVEKVLEK
jgi:uncharacterized protein YjbJ (UPF0337 family)